MYYLLGFLQAKHEGSLNFTRSEFNETTEFKMISNTIDYLNEVLKE